MTATVFLAVLLAAFLHAAWNAVVKGGSDKLISMAGMSIGHALPGLACILVLPLPAPESWPWLAASVAVHYGYQRFLLAAYDVGDFTRVYPLARGSAPLVVTFVSVGALGVVLTGMEILAVTLIAAGLISIALARKGAPDPRATVMALATGGFIAAYSLIDGIGARLSGSPVAYFGWIAFLGAFVFAAHLQRRRPGALRRLPRLAPAAFWGGGLASFAAYAIVVWAFTQAPIALVTALRETSIVFALLIGAFVLREKVDLTKIAATFLTLTGAALLRLSRS